MGQVFFTADTHFGHENIIKYDNRPFADIKEHDNKLIEYWNETVSDGDTVYHLGDFALTSIGYATSILHRLHGKIHFIYGNHDKNTTKKLAERYPDKCTYERFATYLRLPDKPMIIMCHFPMWSWERQSRGTWHLHGHCHGNLGKNSACGCPKKGLRLDVGTTLNNYKPFSLDEVSAFMHRRTALCVRGRS